MNEEATEVTVKTYRIYREKSGNFEGLGTLETELYRPDAQQIGEAFGPGKYLVMEEKEDQSNYIVGFRIEVEATTYFHEKYKES